MRKLTIVLGLLFLFGGLVRVGTHAMILDTPKKWCGAHPPYTGTLWTWAEYGLPFPWISVRTWESCTTTLKGDITLSPGFIPNLVILGVLGYFIESRVTPNIK